MAALNRSMMVNDVGWTKVIFELLYLSRKFQEMHFITIWQSLILAKQLNKLGLQIWVKPILIFETKLNISKSPDKNMGSLLYYWEPS